MTYLKTPIRRRSIVLGAATAVFTTTNAFANGSVEWKTLDVADAGPPAIPANLDRYANDPSLNDVIVGYEPFGTQTPNSEEQKLANIVLDKVPTKCIPVDIALYFLDVASGKYGSEFRPYVTAWPLDWNPVIVRFFTATSTLPAGDTTSWCAAFMNYCLMKGAEGRTLPLGSAQPTMSAAARSFWAWSQSTTSPQPGDIVTFKNKSSPGHGHVGFFLEEQGDQILVLGGNQFIGTPVRHAICRQFIPKNGSVLEFVSYRTDPQLHA